MNRMITIPKNKERYETFEDFEEFIYLNTHMSRDEARTYAREAWNAGLNKYDAQALVKHGDLGKTAMLLFSHKDTEWAEEHADQYDKFAEDIQESYRKGEINSKELNTLACIAFFDYVDLKPLEEYTGEHYVGEIVRHKGGDMIHECKVTGVWNCDGRNGITIVPTGNYGFEIDIYDEQL